MKIKDPRFDQYELVTLHWNGEILPRKVVRRWYDLESESWFYQLSGGNNPPQFFPESLLDEGES